MNKKYSFKTRARLIEQLGQQLIKNESIALLELIKNSYDADARVCLVRMENPDSPPFGSITILDDGEGMSLEVLKSAWLEIGTNYKSSLKNNSDTSRTKKFGRYRLGEKGIGRFGVHRLGKKVIIVTRGTCNNNALEEQEHVLTIDWSIIDETDYIEDLPIEIISRSPQVFKEASGTEIKIDRLRTLWDKRTARECYRVINTLNSPFSSGNDFEVLVEIPGYDWLDGLLSFDEIKEYRLFEFDMTIEKNRIKDLSYKFTPWSTMKSIQSRSIHYSIIDFKSTLPEKNENKDQYSFEARKLSLMLHKEGSNYEEIDLSRYKIGPVRFKGYVFDRDKRTLNMGVQDKSGLKKYLNANGGVRVFRDNMRIMDYGEQGNDWLDLDSRRINMPAKRISKNILLASVFLNYNTSSDLIEKANREGFVENEAYNELVKAIRCGLDRIENLRQKDKEILRKLFGDKNIKIPVTTRISDLTDYVNLKVKDQKIKQNIITRLERINQEYDDIIDNLMKSAGAGLNLTIVIHQMGKLILNVAASLKTRQDPETLIPMVDNLAEMIEGYSILIKKTDIKKFNMRNVIDICLFNIKYRLETHRIKFINDYVKRMDSFAFCSKNHVMNAMLNIIDNSIYWLEYTRKSQLLMEPKILVDISSELPGYVSVIIADNGLGFTESAEEMIKPFVSSKPDGMGIGLHLTDQIMQSLNGKLLFPTPDMFSLPEEFLNGAIIALAFKKEK